MWKYVLFQRLVLHFDKTNRVSGYQKIDYIYLLSSEHSLLVLSWLYPPRPEPLMDIHRMLELVTPSGLERLEAFSQHKYPEIFEIAQRKGMKRGFWETLFWPAKCGPAHGCSKNYSPQLDAEMQIGAMDVAGDGWDLFGGLIWPLLNGKRSVRLVVWTTQ